MADHATVADFYGRFARLYDLLARRAPGVAALRERTAEALALSPGDTVVELGCGTGANFPHLRERVGETGRIVGVDLAPGVVALARERVEREGWRNVHLVRGDAARPPVRGADAVIATFVVGMLDDPGTAVASWHDALEPGGRIALLDAARSERRIAAPANAFLRAFVTATSPPLRRLRYDESPVAVLDRRVGEARDALADGGSLALDERYALGTVRLAVGRA